MISETLKARLKELGEIKEGWIDCGKPIPPKGLLWLIDIWDASMDGCPEPHAYPTPEGHIQLEWDIEKTSMSLTIDLDKQTAYWHVADLGDDNEEDSTESWTQWMGSTDSFKDIKERILEIYSEAEDAQDAKLNIQSVPKP